MNDSQGQALVEGVLILSLLILWVFCFLYLGRFSLALLQWNQDLNYQTYRLAKGAEVTFSYEVQILDQQLGGGMAQSIHQDWNTVLKVAKLKQTRSILDLSLSTQSLVLMGQGEAMQTSKIVAKSSLAWSLPYRYAQSIMSQVSTLLRRIDLVWGRRVATEHWLEHWQGVVK